MKSALLAGPTRSVVDVVNDQFPDVDAGFVNTHNEPVLTTPAVALVGVQTLVVGSTICLIC